jgi:biopolymer transport protein ExbD
MPHRHRQNAFESDDPELEISSLIDVCFLLLIFFLVTTTIQKRETDLGLRLPGKYPATDNQPPIDPMSIRIDAAGAVFSGIASREILLDTDANMRDLPLLRQHVETYAGAARASGTSPMVQITADDAASEQRVVDVLNALAGEQIADIAFTDLGM